MFRPGLTARWRTCRPTLRGSSSPGGATKNTPRWQTRFSSAAAPPPLLLRRWPAAVLPATVDTTLRVPRVSLSIIWWWTVLLVMTVVAQGAAARRCGLSCPPSKQRDNSTARSKSKFAAYATSMRRYT
eukprot:COSAG06_NODE_629_length_13646_cov_13.351222_12_plen_128_part_00